MVGPRRRKARAGRVETAIRTVKIFSSMQEALDRALASLGADAVPNKYKVVLEPLGTLLDGRKGIFAARSAQSLLGEAKEAGEPRDGSRDFKDTMVVVTALPSISKAKLPAMFPEGYLSYLRKFDLDRTGRGQALANWVVLFQPREFTVHLQFLSPHLEGKPVIVFAQDLLSEKERATYLGQ